MTTNESKKPTLTIPGTKGYLTDEERKLLTNIRYRRLNFTLHDLDDHHDMPEYELEIIRNLKSGQIDCIKPEFMKRTYEENETPT